MAELPVVLIHADESCLGNQFRNQPRPGGAAGLMEHWKGNRWIRRDYWLSSPDTTNNRMALTSAIAGLQALKRRSRVLFVSDSQYLVRGMREWVPAWRARGWRRKGGPIENLELWKRVTDLAAGHVIRWDWVRGHEGHPKNEYANHLAIRAARNQDDSHGLVESGFLAWLEEEREERGRYLDYFELAPPETSPDEVIEGE
jgi:ribonuclease HI